MHSLKTARPLLTSVAYFVLFAMLLFSCVNPRSRWYPDLDAIQLGSSELNRSRVHSVALVFYSLPWASQKSKCRIRRAEGGSTHRHCRRCPTSNGMGITGRPKDIFALLVKFARHVDHPSSRRAPPAQQYLRKEEIRSTTSRATITSSTLRFKLRSSRLSPVYASISGSFV